MDTCPYCPLPKHRHPHSVTCGSTSCKKSHHRDRMRQYQRDYAETHGRWANAKYRAQRPSVACAECGSPVKWAAGASARCIRCSAAAASAAAARRRAAGDNWSSWTRRTRAQHRLRKAAEGVRGKKVWRAGCCQRCGKLFVAGSDTAYCRDECRRRARKLRVSAARRQGVYDRDGWVCQICGDPVDRHAKVPALAAPTIDHRIPRNRGGSDAVENLQTAHFYCNSVKRDQLDFDFAEVAA